ncbi:sulfotransferase [Micromonospora sp. DR5-3]|uniref:sulfotransferase family protein n=1 Tax=unclassified Micromonospora TaxID=2617518 RepID=UPI0011DA2CB3|nr:MULTISPECIES: sulfotransferase [unclassified Micromonospora]MCW3818992.1 sulfotransferase [Micromonospora sp. DR5-3]TYC21005.1 sulfotransferase [Micromonospora sp. MP36]
MSAWSVTVTLAGPVPAWLELRRLHHAPFPDASGLLARRVSRDGRHTMLRYLFDSADAAEEFVAATRADRVRAGVAGHSVGTVFGQRGQAQGAGHIGCRPGPVEQGLRRTDIGRPGGPGPAGVGSPVRVDDAELPAPVLVVSAPRSGSTALFDRLARHPALRGLASESEGVIEGVPALHPATGGYRSHHLDTDAARRPAAPLAGDYSAAQAVRYGFLADLPAGPGRRLVEKTPENALRLPFLLAVFPDAVVIHLRRDPRDTVESMLRAWRHPGFVNIPDLPGWRRRAWHLLLPEAWRRLDDADLTRVAAHQWAQATEAILDARSAVPGHRWLDVDYEELRVAPGRTITRLYAALGLPPAPVPDLGRSATTITAPRPSGRRRPSLHPAVLDTLTAAVDRLRREEPTMPAPATPTSRRTWYACWLTDVPATDRTDPAVELRVDPTVVLQDRVSVPLALARRTRFRDRFRPGHPVLWVEDVATGALRAYWVRSEELAAVRSLVPRAVAPAGLPEGLRDRLVGAGVLTTEAERGRRAAAAALADSVAAREFAAGDLCQVTGLVDEPQRRALDRYYETLIGTGGWPLGDDQVAGRYGWHNEPLSRFLHHQFVPLIGRLVGQPVRPSYSYVSAYRAGAVLNRHLDREQCEFTVSLLIAESGPVVAGGWPLHFDTPAGTLTLTQRPGEAVLFRGTRLPHYRPPLPDGNTHTSMLFHYVPAGFRRTLY